MVLWILLIVLAAGVLVDIGITVLLHAKFHDMLEFATWLDRRVVARRLWALALVLLVILRLALGVI